MSPAGDILCQACQGIDFAQPYCETKYRRLGSDVAAHVFYAHHASLKALELSARPGGCRLCKIIFAGIADFNRGQHDIEDDWEHADDLLDEMLAEAEPEPQAPKAHAGFFRPATHPGLDPDDVSAPVILELVLTKPRVFDPDGRSTKVIVHWTDVDAGCRRSTASLCLLSGLPDRVESLLGSRDVDADTHTGSRRALDLARMWLQTCDSTHTACHQIRAAQAQQLPTRVLDVTVRSPDDQDPFLYTAQPGERGDYVSLSHCWGRGRPFKTEMHTLAARQASIPLADMPQTFRDAVEITRRLGHRYLWIDSLCIVQDSKDDWPREAAKMGRYYREAALTVFADAASGDDKGIYCPRDGALAAPCRTPMFDGLEHLLKGTWEDATAAANEEDGKDGEDKPAIRTYMQRKLAHWGAHDMPSVSRPLETVRKLHMGMEPLHLRGWTLQEWILSRRALSFDNTEVRWSCPSLTACECVPEGQGHGEYWEADQSKAVLDPRGEGLWLTQTKSSQPRDGEDDDSVKGRLDHEHYNDWQEVVRRFTERQLTYDTDRLPAMAGMASEFARHINQADPVSIYRAGLWLADLRRGLAWSVYGSSVDAGRLTADAVLGGASSQGSAAQLLATSTYLAPSWSWASTGELVRTVIDSYVAGDNRLHSPGGPPGGSGNRANDDHLENSLRKRARSVECTLVDCQTTPERPENVLGAVSAGSLTLRGHLRRARVVLRHLGRRAPQFETRVGNSDVILMLVPDGDPQGEDAAAAIGSGAINHIPDASHRELASLDADSSTAIFSHSHVWCMPILYDDNQLRCLALVPADDAAPPVSVAASSTPSAGQRKFRRVGLALNVFYGPSEPVDPRKGRAAMSTIDELIAWVKAAPKEEICIV